MHKLSSHSLSALLTSILATMTSIVATTLAFRQMGSPTVIIWIYSCWLFAFLALIAYGCYISIVYETFSCRDTVYPGALALCAIMSVRFAVFIFCALEW